MKKLFSILMVLVLGLSLCACTKTNEPQGPTEVTYKLGMGTVVSTDSSKEVTAQVDATIAAVVLDAEGKIVKCVIDCAQNKVDVTDGVVDLTATFLTKQEKQFDYNMVKYSEAELEWFEQANNFAEYCVGKTAEEVNNTAIKSRDDGLHEGYQVAADAELFAKCSIQITDFVEAVVKACNDDQAKEFTTADEIALGLKIESTVDGGSKNATEEEDGVACIYSDYAAAVTGADGKILAAVTDAIQPKVAVTTEGVGEGTFRGTKRELKEDYNMVKYSEAELEWYQQAANFTDYVAGMTATEVGNIAIKSRDDGLHEGYQVAADADLFAQCSIQITSFISVITGACANAK